MIKSIATESRLILGQVKAPYKGRGENDALFEILETLGIKGATITIDAVATMEIMLLKKN